MLKSTKEILDELYEISPSLKSEKGLKSLVVFMQHHTPKVKPSKDFKKKLGKKLTTISEFKQIQPKQKFNIMVFLTPLALMAFGIFAAMQFYNFVSIDQLDVRTLPSPDSQQFIIDDVSENINTEKELLDLNNLDRSDIENLLDESNQADRIETGNIQDIKKEEQIEEGKQVDVLEITEDELITPEPKSADDEGEEGEVLDEDIQSNGDSEDSEEVQTITNTEEAQIIDQRTIIHDETSSKEEVLEGSDSPNTINTREHIVESEAEDSTIEKNDAIEEINTEESYTFDEGEQADIDISSPESDLYIDSSTLDFETTTSEELNGEKEQPLETSGFDPLNGAVGGAAIQSGQAIQEEIIEDIKPTTIQGGYYTCTGGELDFIDETDKKRIIKTYCNEKGGEFEVDSGVCKLNSKQRIEIDYIQRDLCE